MSENDFLTVKEFAELAGVSRQAINNACKGKLTEYVNIVDGQKRLHKDGLELYGLQVGLLSGKLCVNQPSTSLHDENDNSSDILEKQMDILERQSRIFEKQLDIKDDQLKAKDRQLEEMSKQLSERLKEAHELNRNNQILLGQQQQILEQFEQPAASDQQAPEEKPEPEKLKMSFFDWLKQRF